MSHYVMQTLIKEILNSMQNLRCSPGDVLTPNVNLLPLWTPYHVVPFPSRFTESFYFVMPIFSILILFVLLLIHRVMPSMPPQARSIPSSQTLKLLRAAQSDPYPPDSNPPKPLEFNLEVVEGTPPTADQISTILNYTKKPISSMLSAHPSTATGALPATPRALSVMVESNPKVLKWPIVVNCKPFYVANDLYTWRIKGDHGQASVGDLEAVKEMLESLRKKRDGEEPSEPSEFKPQNWFTWTPTTMYVI